MDVSRETAEKLQKYQELLLKWQKTINLVGPATLPDAKTRHFDDSAQLTPYIPEDAKILVDLGSGAGFPGLVLAILRPDLAVHLIESDARKSSFLSSVSRETVTPVTVHNARIEACAAALSPDIVTARALAPLKELLAFCEGWAARNPALVLLFLKGAQAREEIAEAKKSYDFQLLEYPSKTSGEGVIIRISGLRKK